MLKEIVNYTRKYYAASMGIICSIILSVSCLVVLLPLVFIIGGIDAIVTVMKDDKMPFEY